MASLRHFPGGPAKLDTEYTLGSADFDKVGQSFQQVADKRFAKSRTRST
jgi:hypothetical protein